MNLKEYINHTGFAEKGGQGINIAIIDTGCNIESENIVYRYNPYFNNEDVNDEAGHGTALYEIMNEISPNANYYIIKGLDDYGKGSMKGIYKALTRVSTLKEVDLVCLSFSGFSELSQTTKEALNKCLNNNMKIVSAIGNDNTSRATFPSSVDGVWKVGGLNKSLDDKYSESNYANDTHFVALGEEIETSNRTDSGTSFANAIVVAQIAYIMSKDNISKEQLSYELLSEYFETNERDLKTALGSLYYKKEIDYEE